MMNNSYYRLEIAPLANIGDPHGQSVKRQAVEFLQLPVEDVSTRSVYSLFLKCTEREAEAVRAAFVNPIIEQAFVGESEPNNSFDWFITVGYRPGVTDNVARSAESAIADILDRELAEDENVFTSTEYFIKGAELSEGMVHHLADDLLANQLIQRVTVLPVDEWRKQGAPLNHPIVESEEEPHVETIDMEVDDEELIRINKERVLALTLAELQAVRDYYRRVAPDRREQGLPVEPTDVELECLAQTWSEHCKHKIFNACILYRDEKGEEQKIDSCFKSFVMKSTRELEQELNWLVSVFHDNAGIIEFNDRFNLVYKAETHNSPTALDPYGGSITGIVGVNRDPLGTGMGAELKLNTWGYCFAAPFYPEEQVPEGLFHPRRLRDQVHKGVIDGGNQSGIPYAQGWEYFDERFLGKPLVYCGTVGTIPREILGQPSHEKSIVDGDYVIMVGGRIGKDGIHGATFSSEELHMESPTQAVQIGDPITQKKMTDFLIEARDRRLYRFITDNGAGGLSSSVGEMAEISNGCDIDLAKAPLKYPGLQPWEILLSEAQERMSLAVQPECLDEFLKLAEKRDVEATVLGNFSNDGKFKVRYNDRLVGCLDVDFMHSGLPQMHLQASWQPPVYEEPELKDSELDLSAELANLLATLNICSGEYKARQYDHEVKGLSVVKPYVGVDKNVQSDATVSMLESLSKEGVILSYGFAPAYSDIDTYHMMASVIDTAVRRVIAVGGDMNRIAGLDNFCWPDPVASDKNPDGEYKLAQLVRANMALYDYTKAFKVPCISGKDSMKNDSTMGGRKISIPPSVLFSAISPLYDIDKAVTLTARQPDDRVYVLGTTHAELGGSQFYAARGKTGNRVPAVEPDTAVHLYQQVAKATDRRLCCSLHTPVLGGLGIGFGKMVVAAELGLEIDLDNIPTEEQLQAHELLFSESNSRFIATVAPEDTAEFEQLMADMPCAQVGKVTEKAALTLRYNDEQVVDLPLTKLVNKYTETLDRI
ncbi:MAG: AIR synthase-related protein [Lentisphaeria bacterium]